MNRVKPYVLELYPITRQIKPDSEIYFLVMRRLLPNILWTRFFVPVYLPSPTIPSLNFPFTFPPLPSFPFPPSPLRTSLLPLLTHTSLPYSPSLPCSNYPPVLVLPSHNFIYSPYDHFPSLSLPLTYLFNSPSFTSFHIRALPFTSLALIYHHLTLLHLLLLPITSSPITYYCFSTPQFSAWGKSTTDGLPSAHFP